MKTGTVVYINNWDDPDPLICSIRSDVMLSVTPYQKGIYLQSRLNLLIVVYSELPDYISEQMPSRF